MPPPPGTTNNPHGRPPGTPNKVTAEIRAAIAAGIMPILDELDLILAGMEPKDRLDAVIKLLKFVAPQLRTVELSQLLTPEERAEERAAQEEECAAQEEETNKSIKRFFDTFTDSE